MNDMGTDYEESLEEARASLLKYTVQRDQELKTLLRLWWKRFFRKKLFQIYLELYISSCVLVEICLREVELLKEWYRIVYEIWVLERQRKK